MLFAPYGSELEIILKTPHYRDDNPCTFNEYQAIVNKIKKLKVKRIHAYIEDLPGIDWGRGPFLMLPDELSPSVDLSHKIKRDIMGYLLEYKKSLMKNKLEKTPNLSQLKESFDAFKARIKSIDDRLYASLCGEFEGFEKWAEFYFAHPKLAFLLYRLKKLPRQVLIECKRAFEMVFK